LKENSPATQASPAPLARDRARRLRKENTDAERVLWSHLRNHAMGVKFRRQHPIGNFIVDFVSLEAKLVVEIDGGQHDDNADRLADAQRSQYLEERGYRVVRFWNNDVLRDIDAVLTRIADFLYRSLTRGPLRVPATLYL
jgi:very-short-patch-repair endonuclease